MDGELTHIKDILAEILEELRQKREERKPNDLLTAKDIVEQYDMNYVTVLKQLKDPRLKTYRETKAVRVFRQDYEDYLRGV